MKVRTAFLVSSVGLALVLGACSTTPIQDPTAAGDPNDALLGKEHPSPSVLSRSPGNDTNLGLSWETSVAVNRINPLQVAVVQGSQLRLSQDGGVTFAPSINVGATLPVTHTSRGDGSLGFDSQGRLFMALLGNPAAGGGWDVFVAQLNPLNGATIGVPANVTSLIGDLPGMGADKPWIAVDSSNQGPFADNIYVVWALTGGGLSGEWEIWGARSSDQGATWLPSVRAGFGWGPISPLDASEGRCWTPHVAVGANGWTYVSYHAQGSFITVPGVSGGTPDGLSGQIPILQSQDGGISYNPATPAFLPGEADLTWNAKTRPGAIPDLGVWTIGSGHGWILPHPIDVCELYVVTADDPDNDPTVGDAANVVMATSTDCGTTWSLEIVGGAADNFLSWQLFPTASIDPQTANIAVTWYDNRNAANYPLGSKGNSQFDLMMRYRLSGGLWNPVAKVNDEPIDADASNTTIGSGSPPTYRFGEYNGVAFGECTAHMVWAGTPAAGGGDADIYYDRDPEAGGDVDLPSIVCPGTVTLNCGESIDPIDTGFAMATDNCDLDPRIDYFDTVQPGFACPHGNLARRITRNWRAVDEAGNLATCVQQLRIRNSDRKCCGWK